MTKGKDNKNRAVRKEGFFDPKKEAQDTMNFIGACLHNPMTPEARENIRKWIELKLEIALFEGNKIGWKEGFDACSRILNEGMGETK